MPGRAPKPEPWLAPWRTWYSLNRWRRRRLAQLTDFPLCATCQARGLAVPATVADHVISHEGDWDRFMNGALQSLCKPCHDSGKRAETLRGWSPDLDETGWPSDPRHPANDRSAFHRCNTAP
jgi:hypothetical protein